MTQITEKQLQDLIQQSQYGKPEEFWFSHTNQKQLAFLVAKDLLIDGASVDDSIDIAKEFIDKVYERIIKRGAWERN